MAFDVFISYSNTDKAIADAACATLERSGIRCWIAQRDVPPGSQWAGAIVDAIDHCRVMVLIFSSQANISHQIQREVERAVSKAIPIVPLRIEEVNPTSSMEYFLGSIHWLDALTPPLEKHLQCLAEVVKACLDLSQKGNDASTRSDAAQQAAVSPNATLTLRTPPGDVQRDGSSHKDRAQLPRSPGHRWAVLVALFVPIAAGAGVVLYYLAPASESQWQARDGLYSGAICYGPQREYPERCYPQSAILTRGNISGKWAGRNPGVTVTLAGDVSASGEVKIEMQSDRADGTREATADLLGTLRDGRLDAMGRWRTGGTVTINWRRQ